MVKNNIAKMVAATIGKQPSHKITATKARNKQYKKIFPDIKGKINQKVASKVALDTYVKKLFSGNEWLQEIESDFVFENVVTSKESTKSVNIGGKKNLIVLDTHTRKFLWMMNKSTIYGAQELSVEENILLYSKLFLHFSLVILTDNKVNYPQPKTPNHTTQHGITSLALYTEIQEIFLLAHEVAHVLIDSNEYQDKFDIISSSKKRILLNASLSEESKLNEEILADEIAFEMTLNVYGRDNPDVVQLVCSAIFVMIRYFLWLRVAYKREDEDFEFNLWLSRNSFLRDKIDQVYHWGSPMFVISILESMEERMEPSACITAKILEEKFNYFSCV
ncbi:hypothetical protein [Vibrio campbellii]|uniref:Uncharacterized protein n=1 Tax=Vibrio campbellii TaxID=680 RepID=A0ACC7REX4_9VIBR